MKLIVVLLALGLQRYLHFAGVDYQIKWVDAYFGWLSGKVKPVTEGHGLLGLAILAVPLLLVVSIIVALVCYFFGWVGYFVLGLVLFWYALDARAWDKRPAVEKAQDLFSDSYSRLFGVIFWFFILGPVGLALYFIVIELNLYLLNSEDESVTGLRSYTGFVLGILDWVPERILGLSFALVGHFAATFKLWSKKVISGIRTDLELVIAWGMTALTGSAEAETKPENMAEQLSQASTLIDRALIVWLVLMALFIIGYWFG